MPDLPSCQPGEVVRALERHGFRRSRQSGSHLFLVHETRGLRTTIAMHTRDISKPMLRAVLRQADLTVEEFIELLSK